MSAGGPEAGADPELTRLLAAVEAGDRAAVAGVLAARPALARAHGPDGATALHGAARYDDPALVAMLLAVGADPEARFGDSGHTPLSWALTCRAFAAARTLVGLGARVDLFCAAGLGDLDRIRRCFGADGSPLPGAVRTGSSRSAPDGTRLPCPPPEPAAQVADALAFAARNGHDAAVALLLGHGPDLAFRGYLGGTALHWAHFGGSRAAIDHLRRAGADPGARDDALGCTPRGFGIGVPARWGFAFLVRARLDDDPSLVQGADDGTTPLHEAAAAGHAEIVRLLLDRGADPTRLDRDGRTPLDRAREGGHAELAPLLGDRPSV